MQRVISGRWVRYLRVWAACSLLAGLGYGAPAAAITVPAIHYDPAKDQLVMTVAYRGTNPNHAFTVQWTECRPLQGERSQILGLLVDSQPDDLARRDFTKRVAIDLDDFSCRPAKVTIRTSIGFFTSVDVPARPSRRTGS